MVRSYLLSRNSPKLPSEDPVLLQCNCLEPDICTTLHKNFVKREKTYDIIEAAARCIKQRKSASGMLLFAKLTHLQTN